MIRKEPKLIDAMKLADQMSSSIAWWLYKETGNKRAGQLLDFERAKRVSKILKDKSWH